MFGICFLFFENCAVSKEAHAILKVHSVSFSASFECEISFFKKHELVTNIAYLALSPNLFLEAY